MSEELSFRPNFPYGTQAAKKIRSAALYLPPIIRYNRSNVVRISRGMRKVSAIAAIF